MVRRGRETTLAPSSDHISYARGLRDAAAMLDLTPATIRLHAGEMTAQEMRTVQAVLGWMRREIRERALSVPLGRDANKEAPSNAELSCL